ncbi:MAG TPA: ParB/RepB/Spo0J family partition protein [Acidimicrobiales bacterium]|nr:ParB/RepB/Spo0J family partition protein [Acidimicrobiales bacterium]
MTAVLDAPEATEALEHIPLDQLHPSPANPRRDVGDIAELAASIAELGVIEPLIVAPAGEGGYEVIAGHRRLAAAAKAGIDDVPCIVRHGLADDDVAAMRIVENIHRADLTPLEEAAAYAALAELGLSQRALAKRVSRSQPHISRRLALLKLPEVARAAVDAGGISVEQAVVLARIDAGEIDKLFRRGLPTPYLIQDAVNKQDRAERTAEATRQLRKTGITVLDAPPGPAWKHCLDGPDGYGHLKLTPEDHAGEPCHVAWLDWAAKPTFGCSTPERHDPEGESDLKRRVVDDQEYEEEAAEDETPEEATAREERKAAYEAERAEKDERRARRQSAIDARQAFVAALVAKASDADALELVSLMVAQFNYVEQFYDRQVAALLGIEPDTYGNTSTHDQLVAYAAKGTRNRARALAAGAAVMFESQATPNQYSLGDEKVALYDEYEEATGVWLPWLVAHGYELSDHDRELIPEPEPPAGPAGPDDVAWYDDPEDGPRWVEEAEAEAIEALDAGRLHRMEERVAQTITVAKVGRSKKWAWTCTCGTTGQNTTEAYAGEAGQIHLRDEHGQAAEEASA